MDDLIGFTTVYPVRGVELPLIKRKRKTFITKLIGHRDFASVKEEDVTFKEYVVCGLILQFNVSSVMHTVDLALKYGAGDVVLAYLLVQLCLGLPLVVLCCFLSSYAKKSFITFWESVPLFEGLGYTMILVQSFVQMSYLLTTTSSLLLFFDFVHYRRRDKIIDCDLSDGNRLCYTPGVNVSYICTNDLLERTANNTVYTALQYHFRLNVMRFNQFDLNCCRINTTILAVITGIYTVIFLVSVLGLTHIKKPALNGMIIVSVLLIIMCAYSTVFFEVKSDTILNEGNESKDDSPFFKFDFWVEMIGQLGEGSSVSSTLWLGSLKGRDYSPHGVLIVVICLKTIISMGFFCFVSRVILYLMHTYGFKAIQCMYVTGYDLFMAFIPEAIIRTHIGGMGALLWYISIFYLSILPPIFVTIEMLNSLMEKYLFLARHRMLSYLVMCLIGLVLCLPLCLNINYHIIHVFRHHGLPALRAGALVLTLFAIIFMYSTDRIVDDYSFTYGKPPAKYWIIFWKYSPLIGLITFVFTIYKIRTSNTRLYLQYLVIISYAQAIICGLPIILTSIIKCCTHDKHKTLATLVRPADAWGPYNPARRTARKYYFPQRDVKYRNTTLKCIHTCIVNKGIYHEETRTNQVKLNREIRRFHELYNCDFSSLQTR